MYKVNIFFSELHDVPKEQLDQNESYFAHTMNRFDLQFALDICVGSAKIVGAAYALKVTRNETRECYLKRWLHTKFT